VDEKRTARKKQYERWERAACTVIAASRRDRDMSQAELAHELGWSRTKLAKSESGRRAFRFAEVLLIAVTLGEDPEVLVRRIRRW
jgi:DNA-binding transcriptional regulator YiaG